MLLDPVIQTQQWLFVTRSPQHDLVQSGRGRCTVRVDGVYLKVVQQQLEEVLSGDTPLQSQLRGRRQPTAFCVESKLVVSRRRMRTLSAAMLVE